MVLKLCHNSRSNVSPGNLEGADQPENGADDGAVIFVNVRDDLKMKKMISTPLMMEKPVRSPMVPPMRLSWASVLIFLSLSMSSKVAVSK